MKKFLKRTLAVMLVVCLLASVVPAVSAISVPGANVTQTKTYDFTKEGTTFGNDVNGSRYYPKDDTGAYTSNDWYIWGTRGTNTLNASGFSANYSSSSHSFVIKLNNIPDSVDGKYTVTLNYGTSSARKIFFVKGDTANAFVHKTTSGAEQTYNDTAAGNLNSKPQTVISPDTKNLGDYIVGGTAYLAFYYEGGDTFGGVNLTSIVITYNVAGEDQEVPAATLEQTYDFNPYGANASGTGAFTTGSLNFGYKATNDRYNDGALNWAPVAETMDPKGFYSRYSNEGTGGTLQIRTYYQDWAAIKIKPPAASGEYSMKLNAYRTSTSTRDAKIYIMEYTSALADKTAIAEAISTDTYLQKTVTTLRLKNGGDIEVDLGSYEFDATKEYLVVFYAATTNSMDHPTDASEEAYICLRELVLSQTVYDMPNLSNATQFDKVTLAYNHTGDLDIGGAQVDLNGYTVSGAITSANGEGTVAGYLPLGNGTDYKYYTFTTTTTFSGTNPYKDGNAAYFWFDINFDDETAYERIATGESGLAISAELVLVQAGIEATVEFDTTVTDWAAAQAESTEDIAMGVQVKGLSTIEGSETIGMQFKYSAGNTSGTIGSGLEFEVNN